MRPQLRWPSKAALAQLIAVDGSLLPALRDGLGPVAGRPASGAKMHVAFAVLRQGPIDVTVTAGNGSERAEWRRLVQPGRLYVVDRAMSTYSLFSGTARPAVQLPLPGEGQRRLRGAGGARSGPRRPVHAGVVRDAVLRRLGTAHHTRLLPQPFRMVQVATGKTRKDGDARGLWSWSRIGWTWMLSLLAMAYRYRWAVELVFSRWVKCVLGCGICESGESTGCPPGVCSLFFLLRAC